MNQNNKSHDPVNFQISLKAIIVNDKEEFLLIKAASKHKDWNDTWDLPGGRINKDELDEGFHKIIQREIQEEVGNIKYTLRPDPVSLAKCYYDGETERFFVLFEAKYISGEITLSDEHSDYSWEKINKENVNENFHQVIRELMVNYFKWNK